MHYYIDGYNLLFRVVEASADLQSQRDALLQELAQKAQAIDLSATLVFDAHHQPGPVSRGHFKSLEIVYTSEKESADEYIHRAVTRIKNPRFITVVTSDKKLAWLCRLHGANTESISAFLGWLNRRYQNECFPKVPTKKVKAPPKVIEMPTLPPKPGTVSYYEAIFTGAGSQEPEVKSQEPEARSQEPPLETPKAEDGESDFDRWLRLFEEE